LTEILDKSIAEVTGGIEGPAIRECMLVFSGSHSEQMLQINSKGSCLQQVRQCQARGLIPEEFIYDSKV
jgi:hypothetical protein